MIYALLEESAARGKVVMGAEVLGAMREFRDFMFEKVYLRPEAVAQADKARGVIHSLVDHLEKHPDEIPDSYRIADAPVSLQALDLVAGMTDRYAVRLYEELFIPRPWVEIRTDG
jgi:dGTPase